MCLEWRTMAAGVHVPGELVEDILSRVPVKSLLRFKTASKKWYSLLSQNHQFANFHLKRSKDNLSHHANSLFIFRTWYTSSQFETINTDTNESRKFNIPVHIDTQSDLIGSANGLVCAIVTYIRGCYIWNPCTDECKYIYVPIPLTRAYNQMFCSHLYGFGYDSSSDDYKIVADWGGHFRVFSLKKNSWKKFHYSLFLTENGFHFNGALYWCINGELAIFDLAKEVFSFIPVPDYCPEVLPPPLWDHQGLLYLFGLKSKSIWMMKDSEPWVKLNISLAKEDENPLGISTLGEIVYRVEGGSRFVKSDIHGRVSDDDKSRIVCFPYTFVYTESLISPRCIGVDGLQPQPRAKVIIERPRKRRKISAT